MLGPDLIDRAPELGRVEALLTDATEGFSALEIAGAPGVGKTSLWAQARRTAEARGFTVLFSRPTAAAAKSSFGALADLLFPVDPLLLEALPGLQRDVLEVVLLRQRSPGRSTLHRAVAAGFLALTCELSKSGPVLIAIDDWQWLDQPSRDALEFTAHRLERERVRIVYSLRTPATCDGLRNAVVDERLTRITLAGLRVSSVARLVSERLGQTLPRPLLVRIADMTAGNPFHVLELARAVAEQGAELTPGGELPVPDNLRELMLAQIDRLPRSSREALELVAVISEPTTESIDPRSLHPAEQAGIVTIERGGRIVFTHPLRSAAVHSALSSIERRRVHSRAAELVTDPEQRARHLALAATGASVEVASHLDAATTLAEQRGAPGAGAELAELAADLTPVADPAARAERLVRGARLLLAVGDPKRAERLLERALTLDIPAATRASALQATGQLAGHRHNWTAAADRARAALPLAVGNPELLAGIECDLAFASASIGDFPGALTHGQAAAEHAALIGDSGTQAIALSVLAMVAFLGGGGIQHEPLERALALEDPRLSDGLMMRPRFIAALLELWTGGAATAADELEALYAELIGRGQEGIAPMAAPFVAWAHLWRGDFTAAAKIAARAQDAAALLDEPGVTATAQTASALVHAFRGETDQARAAAQQALALFAELQWASAMIWPSWALGLAALGADDPEGVHELLGPLGEQLAAMGAGDPIVGMFVPDEVEALVALGREAEATVLLDWFEDRARALEAAWALALVARCRGELAAREGDIEAASAAFSAALAAHDQIPIPFDRARTLLVAGRCLRRAKRRRAAVESLSEAARTFVSLGAAGWAARADSELKRVGRRMPDPDILTEGERLIAELAASGLSNRQIAERAFVSVKTVEANLTRTYRKLGIRSRAGLAMALPR